MLIAPEKTSNMERVISGINEGELNALSMEVLNHRDNISEIFEKVDACIDRLQAVYRGQPCNGIIGYYNQIKPSFATTKENIRSYSDDLLMLIEKIKENADYLSGLFDDLTNRVKHEIKYNEFTIGK